MNITNDNDLDIKNILKKEEQDTSVIISCSFAYASALSDDGFENYIKDLHEAREFNTKLINHESDNTK